MTEYEVEKSFQVILSDARLRTYNKEDQLLVDRVILETEDERIKPGKITVNPRVTDTERKEKEVDGKTYPTETQKKRDPTVREFSNEFDKLEKLVRTIQDQTVELEGMVRKIRDSPGDEWNWFIRTSELDHVTARTVDQDEDGL